MTFLLHTGQNICWRSGPDRPAIAGDSGSFYSPAGDFIRKYCHCKVKRQGPGDSVKPNENGGMPALHRRI